MGELFLPDGHYGSGAVEIVWEGIGSAASPKVTLAAEDLMILYI